MLDERKIKVLYAIINSYVNSAEPIGSRTISKTYDFGVGPATIRNEMSDLEDLGYLSKPHSSAGRVPSDKAYRLYVDNLIKVNKDKEYDAINNKLVKILVKESNQVDELIKNAAKILSAMTNYTSIVASPKMEESKIEKIQLVPVDNVGILIVMVCDNGVVKNSILKSQDEITGDQLNVISNFLNSKLQGLPIDEMLLVLNDDEIFKELFEFKDIIDNLIPIMSSTVEDMISVDLYSEGITNILNFPEYKDIDKAREFISFIEDKELLLDVLSKSSTSDDLDIIIGTENIYAPIKDISIITATYTIQGETIGKVGLVGPTRMDYENLIKTVKLFSDNITAVMRMLIE